MKELKTFSELRKTIKQTGEVYVEIDVMGVARYVRVVKSDLLNELSKDNGHLDDYNNPVVDGKGNVWI